MTEVKDIPVIILPHSFAICRLAPDHPFPDWANSSQIISYTRTADELSVVCEERFIPPEVKSESGWRVIKVQGPLDFSIIGVLAAISSPLAKAGVSIFVISTYDTDYVLVKEIVLERATEVLISEGFLVLNDVRLSA
jgi:uncharacterized protein